MKYLAVMLVLCLVILLSVAGCSTPESRIGPATSPTPMPVTATPPSVMPSSVPLPEASSLPPSPTPRTAYTGDEINQHFIDLAFGADNENIRRFSSPITVVAITGSYTDKDVADLNRFFLVFNNYSTSTRLPSEVKQSDKGDVVIWFVPGTGLEGINTDNMGKVYRNPSTGIINYIFRTSQYQAITTETMYINSDLTGNERTHWLLRGLLYELGLPGETGTYPDSLFYSSYNGVTDLSPIDLKVLQLLYGNKIRQGMTLDDVRSILVIRN